MTGRAFAAPRCRSASWVVSMLLASPFASLVAQQQAPAVQPVKLPDDWAQRDLEGKWVVYRQAVLTGGKETTVPAAWAAALADAGEPELLEWIAMFEGWRHAGPQLAKLDAPQLLRVAAWNLGAFDSHNTDTAQNALQQRGAATLAWLDAHPAAQRGKAAAIRLDLEKAGTVAAETVKYLPPLDPMQVLVPLLDAPAALVDFGERKTAEPRVRYVHQVLRALDGVLVFGDADDMIVQKVLALARHNHTAVSSAAFHTLSKLPAGSVPYEALVRIVADPAAAPERRRIATMALSFSSHPVAFFTLHEIALDAAHPASDVAIARLGEIGDDTTAAALQGYVVADLERGKRIGAALAAVERRKKASEFLQPPRMSALLWRVAWLQVQRDDRAKAHAEAAASLLRSQAGQLQLTDFVEPFTQVPIPGSPFRGDEAQRIDQAVVEFTMDLLRTR